MDWSTERVQGKMRGQVLPDVLAMAALDDFVGAESRLRPMCHAFIFACAIWGSHEYVFCVLGAAVVVFPLDLA